MKITEIKNVTPVVQEAVELESVGSNKSFKAKAKKFVNAVTPFVGVALAITATAVLAKRVVTPREQKED